MKNTARWLMLVVASCCWACSSSESGGDAGDNTSSASQEVRNARYCEILLVNREGTQARIDVYNTYGLNDCPADQWNALDTNQIKEERNATSVIMNGPRYFVLDAFVDSELADPTVTTFGGIEMRKPAEMHVSLAELTSLSGIYSARKVERKTTYIYKAATMVYELVDADGKVWVMQSYDGQKGQLSEEALAQMGGQLKPPAGWSFRARRLTEDLQVKAVDGVAQVLRDDLASTYQLSAQ